MFNIKNKEKTYIEFRIYLKIIIILKIISYKITNK